MTQLPNLLLVHGGPGMDDSYFFPFLEPLRKHFAIHSYAQGTDVELGTSPIDDLVNELQDHISSMDGSRKFILAHSFGAALALERIRRFGDSDLDGLILVSWICDLEWQSIFDNRNP